MAKAAFPLKLAVFGVSFLALGACDRLGNLDFDLRGGAGGLDTSDAVRNATASAPQPDARGVVSYPGYQVAVARRGDTVDSIASRIGLSAAELASFNALPRNVPLREGEIIALPGRVSEPALAGTGNDVTAIAGAAIDRSEGLPGRPAGDQPARHQVKPGETAFSIARLYGVPVASLAEWNGLGADLSLRDGQFLLIPIRLPEGEVQVSSIDDAADPGVGTEAPPPPSAAQPLPEEDVRPAATVASAAVTTAAVAAPEPTPTPPPTPLAETQTAASDTSRLRMPVQGRIIRPYEKGENEGIGISASAGTSVVAADNGTVAAITRDTDQVPILVLRHADNLLTVYAGVDEIGVKKGDSVKRGEKIAVVRAATPPFLHFEVREGFDSVDPMPYLK